MRQEAGTLQWHLCIPSDTGKHTGGGKGGIRNEITAEYGSPAAEVSVGK